MQTANHASHYKYGVVGKSSMARRLFDDKLIHCVRCRSVIFNTSIKYFRNIRLKERAWLEVTAVRYILNVNVERLDNVKIIRSRMWANAQHDGRPAE